jgi:succinate-semialdehyde dehydrogenase / glutarate-semialdehyde dehydrogenase
MERTKKLNCIMLFATLNFSLLPSTRTSTRSFPVVVRRGLVSLLSDPSLIQQETTTQTDIGDQVFPVYDPASPDSVIAEVPIHNGQDARSAIERCHQALPSWRDGTTAMYRASLLTKWSDLMQRNAEDLAIIMTLESGKPLTESRGEVQYARSFLDYFASEAIRATGAGGGFMVPTPFTLPDGNTPKGHIMAIQQAVGVSALIAPWNFPLAMITRKVGPALAAGCTAVAKPSELTPLSAIALKTLADRAGIPPGVFELV